MWLGDPIQYKHYTKLQDLMTAMMQDYLEWKEKYSVDKKCIDAGLRYKMPAENAGGFMALPVIDAREIKMPWAEGWDRTMTAAFDCPGMIDMCINFIRPGMMLPVHHDGYVWDWIRKSMNNPKLSGYTISFGISIPEPSKQALIFDEEKRIWGTGEFRAFNGHDIQHQLTNRSKEHWRVTAVMEVEEKYFDIQDSKSV